MTKRDTVKEAIEQLDSLTYNWRAIPDKSEVKGLLEWVFEKGKQSRPTPKKQAAIMGARGGTLSRRTINPDQQKKMQLGRKKR